MNTIPFTPANQKQQTIHRIATRIIICIGIILVCITAYQAYCYWRARSAYTNAHEALQTTTAPHATDNGVALLKKYSNPTRQSPAALISVFANAVPENLQLTHVSRQHKKQVTLTGITDTLDTLMLFVQRLHEAPLLRNVTLKTATANTEKKNIAFSIHACMNTVGDTAKK